MKQPLLFAALVSLVACRGESASTEVAPEPTVSPAANAPATSTPIAAGTAEPAAAPSEPHGGHSHDWNDIYVGGVGFNSKPNALLVDSIRGVAPGKALDIGMGQGRNAVFLAAAGWDVTGVDTAAEGVRIANETATAAGVQIRGVVEDMKTFDMGRDRWDLIAYIYMGERELLEPMKAALAPGGRVVIEFLHSDSNDFFPHPINGFETGELERVFAGFRIVTSEIVEDVADFGERSAKLVRFIAEKPAA